MLKITFSLIQYLVGALYSNMDWWWVASIFSNEQGIGSLHSRSWFSALSASSLTRSAKVKSDFQRLPAA